MKPIEKIDVSEIEKIFSNNIDEIKSQISYRSFSNRLVHGNTIYELYGSDDGEFEKLVLMKDKLFSCDRVVFRPSDINANGFQMILKQLITVLNTRERENKQQKMKEIMK